MFAPAAVLFLLESYDLLLFLPRLRILEARICRDYYTSIGSDLLLAASLMGDESRCKVAQVQSQLAVIRGWQVFFDALPGEPTPLPYLHTTNHRIIVVFFFKQNDFGHESFVFKSVAESP